MEYGKAVGLLDSSLLLFSAVVGTEAKTSCTLGKHLMTDVFPQCLSIFSL